MTDHAKDQARAQHDSLATLVAALDCDFGRLEELRGRAEENRAITASYAEKMDDWQANADATEELEELRELEEQAAGYDSRDDVVQAIEENALSVEVRSGWQTMDNWLVPEEFRIVLCTGGPHVQITGELDHNGEPRRAWLEYQDWGTPLTQYLDADQDVLLAYARCFYFGG